MVIVQYHVPRSDAHFKIMDMADWISCTISSSVTVILQRWYDDDMMFAVFSRHYP